MTQNDLLEQIIDRLGRAESGDEVFGADEAANWPDGAVDVLTKAGLLRRARPAQAIGCNGCERLCFMPVQIRPADGNQIARAFISCDKRDDIGRVPVELRRLRQWRIAGALVADTLARQLGFAKARLDDEGAGKRWKLGLLKGKAHRGDVKLAIENGVTLMVSGHSIPLADLVTLDGGGLSVDRDELVRLVDNPVGQPSAKGYSPSVARRESRKLDTQKHYETWQKAYRALKRTRGNMSDVWYSQQIARTDIGVGRDAETIRKHMKK